MKKTLKRLDNKIVRALTIACEKAKKEVPGFQWLTHRASYDNFPASLIVTCIFDSNQSLAQAQSQEMHHYIRNLIQGQLLNSGIVLKDARRHVRFDTEEACLAQHQGDWQKRLL